MKIAVLADVHANLVAFQTVVAHIKQWQPDQVVVAGDTVNRGPRPRECLHLLQDKMATAGWLVVRGNHEEYVIHQAHPDRPQSGPEYDFFQATHWTHRQLGAEVAALEAMPFQVSLMGPDGSEVRVVHASMFGTRDGIFTHTSDDEIRRKITPAPQVFCVGHTHRPLIRQIDETLVVNVGSAGLSFDSDHRVAYGQLTWQHGRWQAEIIRLIYDYEVAERDFYETTYLAEGGPLVELVLDELRCADSRLAAWASVYEAQVLAGQISMAESVRRFLKSIRN